MWLQASKISKPISYEWLSHPDDMYRPQDKWRDYRDISKIKGKPFLHVRFLLDLDTFQCSGIQAFFFHWFFVILRIFLGIFFLFVLCFYTNIAIQFGTILHSSAQRFPYKFSHRFRNKSASFGPTVCQIFLHRRCLYKYVDSTIASETNRCVLKQ